MANKIKDSIKVKVIKTVTVSFVGSIVGVLLFFILLHFSSPDIFISISMIGMPIVSGIIILFLIRESLVDKVLYAIFAFILDIVFYFLIFQIILLIK